MPTGTSLQILSSDLIQIVGSVFESMLGLEVSESEALWFPSADRLTAAVHLAGDWNGVVLLECDGWQARQFTGHFLSADPPVRVDDVARDMLGELVNMIGGNVKCVLGRGLQLSMPSVVDGSNYGVRICGAEIRTRVALQCLDGPFWVTVLGMRARSPAIA